MEAVGTVQSAPPLPLKRRPLLEGPFLFLIGNLRNFSVSQMAGYSLV
jgi:hypothetical protein